MLFSLLKHYLNTDTDLKVSQSVYCFTTSTSHGVQTISCLGIFVIQLSTIVFERIRWSAEGPINFTLVKWSYTLPGLSVAVTLLSISLPFPGVFHYRIHGGGGFRGFDPPPPPHLEK